MQLEQLKLNQLFLKRVDPACVEGIIYYPEGGVGTDVSCFYLSGNCRNKYALDTLDIFLDDFLIICFLQCAKLWINFRLFFFLMTRPSVSSMG